MELHDVIGSFGPWQGWVFAVFFYINLVGIWQNLAITFLAPNVPFRCIEPSTLDWLNRSRQEYYDGSCTSPLAGNGTDNVTWVPCTKWEYDTSFFSDTIVSEWDLVCEREWLVSLSKSIYMVGFLLSVIVFGQISDCLGRFPAIVLSYVITIVSMLLSLMSTSYVMFAILRFFQAFGRTGLTTVGFVLVMEIFGPQHRTGAGIALQLGWSIGFAALAGVGWLFRHWFWFQVALCVPVVPIAFAYGIVPESPRWLQMQGKREKLEKLIVKATRMNNREIKGDVKDLDIFRTTSDDKDKKTKTLIDLLRMPVMRNRTFNMVYLWVVNAFVYYGLTYNTNDLAGDMYLNFLLSGLMELPSYAVLYWGIRRFGRRPTLLAFMLGAGVSCAAIALTPSPGSDHSWTGAALALAGKFCVSASFGLLYLYTNELYPTVVRNVALGACSMCARVGSILAPFVRELGKATHSSVPNVLYGVLAISSGLLAFAYLPETSGGKLPDTLEEGERYGRPSDDAKTSEKNEETDRNVENSKRSSAESSYL